MNNKKTIVVIGGPTATGKTRVAIGLAKYYNTEIISADSRQCYRELKIGVARPSTEELSQTPHHFIATHSMHEATGHSILSFRTGQRNLRDFRIIKIALETPREKLYRQINARVDKMMDQGLVDEVKSLLQFKHLNPLKTVGYKELFAYLEKEIDLNQAIEEIKKNTRQYAKRQLTWFKKDASFHWVSADQYDAVFSYIATRMDKN